MKATTRQTVFYKFFGKCAYCGTELLHGWHVDHIKPKVYGGSDELENLNPSCKDCNTYKCHTDLETYRNQLRKMLNEKLEYLFKSKTKMNVAMKMGSIYHVMFLYIRCVLQDRIGLNDISPYFLYLLLCISCFWSGKCSETGGVTISLCGMKSSNQKQLYITGCR